MTYNFDRNAIINGLAVYYDNADDVDYQAIADDLDSYAYANGLNVRTIDDIDSDTFETICERNA